MTKDEEIYLEQLNKVFIESSKQFETQLLYIASGALGLSFAFIKDIVDLASATHKDILIASWILFALVIMISLTSSYTSLKSIIKKIENLLNKKNKEAEKINSITKKLNVLMLIFLATGLFCLTYFVAKNI